MPQGIVKWYDREKGYGSIQPDEGGETILLQAQALAPLKLQRVLARQRVSYRLEQGEGWVRAVDVELL